MAALDHVPEHYDPSINLFLVPNPVVREWNEVILPEMYGIIGEYINLVRDRRANHNLMNDPVGYETETTAVVQYIRDMMKDAADVCFKALELGCEPMLLRPVLDVVDQLG